MVETATLLAASTVGLAVDGETIPYVSGWGEHGASEAVTEFAETIDQVARRIEEVLLAASEQAPGNRCAVRHEPGQRAGRFTFGAVHHDGARPKGNIDHVAIRVNDVGASTAFYSTVGAAAGLAIRGKTPDRATISVGADGGSLLVIAGEPAQNIHIAFSGEDDDVRRFHTDATAAGYRSNGEPGERPRYHQGYYAAYVLDPDGNNIEVVNHRR